MAQQFSVIVLLATLAVTLLSPPASSREIIRNWERIQENRRQREGNTRETRMQGNQEGVQELHGAVNSGGDSAAKSVAGR